MNESPRTESAPASLPWNRDISRHELFAAAAIVLVAALLHLIFLTHAGGLWRDEAGFVNLATLPSWSNVWEMLPHDHCPILVPALVRIWRELGFGNTDFGLRILGFCMGMAVPACLLATGWMMRKRAPLLALALVAINVPAIRAGDSLRAYGLGSALNVLCLGLIWRAAKNPAARSTLLAATAALVSVQCLYQNAVFVFAACCGGCAVCLMENRRRDVLRMLGIGVPAALSLVPYVVPLMRSQDWWILEKAGFTVGGGWHNLATLMGFPLADVAWLWVGLILFALFIALSSGGTAPSNGTRALVIFNALALVIGIAGFFIFLKASKLPTQSWYYLPLLAFMAVCADAMLADCRPWMATGTIAFSVLMAAACLLSGISQAAVRETNMDLVAARLQKEAAPGDMIIVHPWYYAVSFDRYYHGNAAWTTLPPLAHHDVHRYDELKAMMQEQHPIQPVIDQISSTLQNGHRVWLVGWMKVSSEPAPEMKPAPNNSWGWLDEPYSIVWGMQAGNAITAHAEQGVQVAKITDDEVNPYEDVPVFVFSGWKSAL